MTSVFGEYGGFAGDVLDDAPALSLTGTRVPANVLSATDAGTPAKARPDDVPLAPQPSPQLPKKSRAPLEVEEAEAVLENAETVVADDGLRVIGPDAPAPDAPTEPRAAAYDEARVRQLEALRAATAANRPLATALSETETALIDSVYRNASDQTIRQTRDDLLATAPPEIRAIYNELFVSPALAELVRTTRELAFGEIMPLPEPVLRTYLDEYASRIDSGSGVPGTALDDVSTDQLARILDEHAAWPEFRDWLGPDVSARARAAIFRLAGVGSSGNVERPDAFAAARLRRPFALSRLVEAMTALARQAVFRKRDAVARNVAAYEQAVWTALARSSPLETPPLVRALPLADRAERIRRALAASPVLPLPDAAEAVLLAGIVVTQPPDDGNEARLSDEFALADADSSDAPSAGLALRQRLEQLAGRLVTDAVVVYADAALGGLRARRAAARRVPLVARRWQTDAEPFVLSIRLVGARTRALRVEWRFRPWNGEPERALGDVDEVPANVADERVVSRVVVDASPCGAPRAVRYVGERVGGRYWALVSVAGDASPPVRSATAELHVLARCVRDGAEFEDTGMAREMGECVWRPGPPSRKRRREQFRAFPNDPALRMLAALDEDEDEDGNDDDDVAKERRIDLGDDHAVLIAAKTTNVSADVYSYLATLERIDARIRRATRETLVSFVQSVARGDVAEARDLEAGWRTALAVGADVSARATSARALPVLSVLAALQVGVGRASTRPSEARFLLDALAQRLLLDFTTAWRRTSSGQRYALGRVDALVPSRILTAADADRRERLAAKTAVARMSYDQIVGAVDVWRDAPAGPLALGAAGFFTDAASLARFASRARAAERREQAGLAPARRDETLWTGVHDAESRDPDWYEVEFVPIGPAGNGSRLAVCELVRRGSERPAVRGAHERITALRIQHNDLARQTFEAGPGLPGIQTVSAVLRLTRLRAAIEAAVKAFNRAAQLGGDGGDV